MESRGAQESIQTQVWVKSRHIFLTCLGKSYLPAEKNSLTSTSFQPRGFYKLNFLRSMVYGSLSCKTNLIKNPLQIFHTGGDHWKCAATISKPWFIVQLWIYEETAISLFTQQILFHIKNVQKQPGGKECGLYTPLLMQKALHLEKTLVR